LNLKKLCASPNSKLKIVSSQDVYFFLILVSFFSTGTEQSAAGQGFTPLFAPESSEPAPAAVAPSYEQLRRRNRESGGLATPIHPPPPSPAPLQPSTPPAAAFQQPTDSLSSTLYRPMPIPKGSNKYGDEGFE
jgi:hypothetical protein